MVRSFFLLYDDLLESLGMNAKLSAANYPSGLLSFADSRPVSSLLAMFISHRAFHHTHFCRAFMFARYWLRSRCTWNTITYFDFQGCL